MRFQYVPFGGTAPRGAAACDGLVPGARLDLSHWSGNRTPAHLKADTSVEIALAFARERSAHDVEVAVNNHFDADGVLAVWSLLHPEAALAHEEVIVGAAEHGDFDEWPRDDRGIWLEAAIGKIAGGGDEQSYARVLGELDDLVHRIAARESLWGDAYRALIGEEALLSNGRVTIERSGRIALITHEAGAPELSGSWISRRRPAGTDRLLLAFGDRRGGWRYRYELPRWAWADTVRRPRLALPRRGPIRRRLGPEWIIKGRRGMTGLSYTLAPIAMAPRAVARALAEIDAA